MNNCNAKIVLLTGGSSGIGFETAQTLALQGHIVYAAARRTELMTPLQKYGVHILSMDLTDDDSMKRAVDLVLCEQHRIDVLINNAGYGSLGAIENVSLEEARRQLDVNLFGLARLTQLVLPGMRQQKSGRIINVSSIAGKIVLAHCGWYNVSKFAVEALSDALRMETHPFGIDVVLVEPSAIKTDWGLIAANHLEMSSRATAYEEAATREAELARWAYTANFLSGPKVVCRAICRAVNARRPAVRYRPGMGAVSMLLLHAVLPARWWDAINRWAIGLR